jgi:hypothetical protein
VADSRREKFDIHAEEQAQVLRCLLCQQWIEADHEEALALERARAAGTADETAGEETRFDVLR